MLSTTPQLSVPQPWFVLCCLPHPRLGSSSGRWGCKEESPRLQRLYQGSLQEEYGCNALVLVRDHPAVPAAAAELALGLRVQVELGAKGAILPALLILGWDGVVLWGGEQNVTFPPWHGVWATAPTQAALSPAAGRRGSPPPGSASRGSGSAHVPSAAGGMSSRSFPLSSRPEVGPTAQSPLRIPSLQGQGHSRGCQVAMGWEVWTCLKNGPKKAG